MRNGILILDKPTANRESNGSTADASAPEVLERLIRQAEQAGASDIHLHMRGQTAEVCFRLDGVITPARELPAGVAERVCGRIKFLARLKTYQDSLPQDGRIDRQEARAQNDIRVATYPTVTGEKIVLRLFNSSAVKSLRELELSGEVCDELERFLRQTSGLLLLTGPAGSGKTTTIYACLRGLAELGGRHVITVEDPVEQVVPGIMQTEVNEARGLDFARAARHLLRQDPQVLVIGEVRDEETANIVVRVVLMGHLVISTLHAGSCQGVFERLLVLCQDHSAVASSVELVLNQRLVRRRCQECSAGSAGIPAGEFPSENQQPAGQGGGVPGHRCPVCLGTGYRGRLPLVEWLRLNAAMRRRLAARDVESLVAQHSLAESAPNLVRAGLTSQGELNRVLGFDVAA